MPGVGGGRVRVVREKEEEELRATTPRVRCKRRGGQLWTGRGLLWEVLVRAMRTSAPILRCGARGDVRLGERGNSSVGETFCYCWSRVRKAVVAAADETLEGDEGRRHLWVEGRNRAWLYNTEPCSEALSKLALG